MAKSYAGQIRYRIEESTEGTMFISADFADIADTETIRRNLNRLTQDGVIRRVLNGIYQKSKYTTCCKSMLPPTQMPWRRLLRATIIGQLLPAETLH